MDLLMQKKAWVVFNFSDGSKQTILTTLSKQILRDSGISPKEGALWDFNRGDYVAYREDAESIDVFADKPVFDEEVNQFGSRFI